MNKVFFVLLLCTNLIYGDLGKFKGWEKTWVKHLLTEKELKEFKKIKTEKEAEIFISNFWKKRDPTPGTEENEFKERCENLAKYADREFSTKNKRGSETERGRVLLLLGYPSFIKRQDSS
ncbi:MAG: GWxTD domain-containing protein, partial [Thermoanaerobaculia bacterium]